jgi:hypothetical protein
MRSFGHSRTSRQRSSCGVKRHSTKAASARRRAPLFVAQHADPAPSHQFFFRTIGASHPGSPEPGRALRRASGWKTSRTNEITPNSATEIPPNSAMDRALIPDLALFDAPGERIEMRWSSRYTLCTRRLSDPHEVNVPLKNRSKQAQGCCVRRPRLIHETLTRALRPRGLSPFGSPKQSSGRWSRLPRSRIAVNSLQTSRACDRLMLADRLRRNVASTTVFSRNGC